MPIEASKKHGLMACVLDMSESLLYSNISPWGGDTYAYHTLASRCGMGSPQCAVWLTFRLNTRFKPREPKRQ